MSKLVATLFLSVGVGLVVVGIYTAAYALLGEQVYYSTSPWPFGGTWDSGRFLLNSVAALAVGSGLVTIGLTWVRFLLQQGSSPFFTRRRVLLTVGIPLGVCLVLAGYFWLSPSTRPISEADRQAVTEATIDYIAAQGKHESHKFETLEFQERLAARKERVYYSYASFRVEQIVPGTTMLESSALGHLKKSKKHTEKDEGTLMMIEDQPKRVKFVLRLIRTAGGPWLVDDAQFTEEGL